MPSTIFAKIASQTEIELLAKKEAVKIDARRMGMTEDEIKTVFRSRRAETTGEQVKILEELTEKKKTRHDGGCPDGEHCQRLVTEEELPGLLAEGWRVAAVLPSGKVVISNEQ